MAITARRVLILSPKFQLDENIEAGHEAHDSKCQQDVLCQTASRIRTWRSADNSADVKCIYAEKSQSLNRPRSRGQSLF